MKPCGISVGNELEASLRRGKILKRLKTIEFDALSDVSPLLRIAPNLETLRMNLPCGYAQYTNYQLITALQYVPKLRALTYSAESLRVGTFHRVRSLEPTAFAEMEESDEYWSVELIKSIGRVAPALESLDLQSRWYGVGGEVLFPFCTDVVASKVRSQTQMWV